MQNENAVVDVLLVGAGVMSATLGALLKELDPSLSIEVVEALDQGAAESSNPWNNAGTGHAGLCELNYTPAAADGSIDPQKALHIHALFEVSKQFWSHLVGLEGFGAAKEFINPIAHMSFVRGAQDVAYLKRRFETLVQHHCFASMQYTENPEQIAQWAPLLMQGRAVNQSLACTSVAEGTDVNFGALTKLLLKHLARQAGVGIGYSQKVTYLKRHNYGWLIETTDRYTNYKRSIRARFVFLGAGGGALPLLQKSGIPEARGYGGFPVSGQWLCCEHPNVVGQHQAKVYSQAEVGAPPMSVPHLDTRLVDGRSSLLFGPYAGFSTKFLKYGSYLDLPLSVRFDNLMPMLQVARDNLDLTRYLVKEVLQSMENRFAALQAFYPEANKADWRLKIAGQRVQIIKKDSQQGGKLEFGTEIVTASDGSMAALLGASPGASVSVSAMLDLLARCFPQQMQSAAWQERLQQIVPASAQALQIDATLYAQIRARSARALQLEQ